jgi:hypothetical protein
MNFTQPWGFSKLDVYRACPQKFAYQFIERIPQASSAAMERGQKMHEDIESYLNGWKQELMPSLATWQPALDKLKAQNFKGEQALGIDDEWCLLPDWFDKRTWLRVKMDAYYIENGVFNAIDFKSGKYRVPSQDQIELYAVASLSIEPTITSATAQFWFLDTDDVFSKTYTRDELIALRAKYEVASAPLYTDTTWKPTPSNECRWCPYSKTKGGKCQY